jgi:hypothetical protein
MAITRNRAVGLGALATVLIAGGCTSTYEVNVRNQADQPITAEIRAGKSSGASELLKSRRIPPGDRAWLGPARAGTLKTVFLTVDFEGNVETPVVLKLKGGTTAVNVDRADEGARGTVVLEEVRP